MENLSKAATEALIADLSQKIGLRPQFVKDYLDAQGVAIADLSRAVVGAAVAGKLREVSAAIFNDAALPTFA